MGSTLPSIKACREKNHMECEHPREINNENNFFSKLLNKSPSKPEEKPMEPQPNTAIYSRKKKKKSPEKLLTKEEIRDLLISTMEKMKKHSNKEKLLEMQ